MRVQGALISDNRIKTWLNFKHWLLIPIEKGFRLSSREDELNL